MNLLKQSTARDIMVLMVDAADHVTGKTGLTLTISLSKNAGAFASVSPTVTERGNGWYAIALTSAHTDTLGDLAIHITAPGADPTDKGCGVYVSLPGEISLTDTAEAVRDVVVEGTVTLGQCVHLAAAGVGSKTSGMDGSSPKIRSLSDDRDLVAGTADANGNRTAVTRNL